MTKKLIAVCLAILSIAVYSKASDKPAPPPIDDAAEYSLFGKGKISISPYASYRVKDFDGVLDRFGGGAQISYFVVDNLALEANFLSEGLQFHDKSFADSFTDAGGNVKGYWPLGKTGFAPYILVGYTRGLKLDENRMNAGAGLELRGKYGLVFADGQWTHDFDRVAHAVLRLGAGFHF